MAFLGSLVQSLTGDSGNPLTKESKGLGSSSYQALNYDSGNVYKNSLVDTIPLSLTCFPSCLVLLALAVLDAFQSALNEIPSTSAANPPRSFVYISAEDIFKPFVPRGYIDTKRTAERDISITCASNPSSFVQPTFIRPGALVLSLLLRLILQSHPFKS